MVRAEAGRLLAAGVSGQVFPGATACVSFREADQVETVVACAGTLAKGEQRVQDTTPYDLGGLTETFVATAALRMAARGDLDLDAVVEAVLPDARGGALGSTTLRALLWHRGGLAAWGGLYLDVPHDLGSPAARRWVVSEAVRRPGERQAGQLERSDLGYIVAGEAIARLAGRSLDRVLAQEVNVPLAIGDELLYPGALPADRRASFARRAAPTERCSWRGRLIRGEVQDENAAALGGVAANAGLFGSALAVATFGRAVLDSVAGRGDYVASDAIRTAVSAAPDGGHVRMGWEGRDGPTPACGRRMGPASFGKFGFTGTSLWCDPARDVVIVLLTNRICPSRANEKIEGFRPAFHDGMLAAISA